MRPFPAFILGAVVAPLLGPILRPLVREVVKGGVLLAHELEKISHEVREEVEDAKAEATSQISRKKKA
jgi:Protein of unknown function (DUF5132)